MSANQPLQGAAAVMSASDEAIFQSVNDCFTYVNGAAERMFGYRAHELIGHSSLLLAPAQRGLEIANIRTRVRRGETVSIETQRLRRDGALLDVAITALPVFDEQGIVIGETAIVRDRTEQLRLARKLREADANIRAIFDHVPCGMSLRGLDGRYLQVNKTVADALDASPTELVGRDPSEHHDRTIALAIDAEDREMLRTGEPLIQEHAITRADGSERDYFVLRYPVRDEHGEVFGFGAFSLDITASKRIERELREAEQGLRMLLEAAPDAVVMVNGDGLIVRLNAKAEEVFGFARKDLLGEPVEMLIAAELREAHVAYRREYLAQPGPRQFETTCRRRDGSDFPAEISLDVMPADGDILIVSAIRDISVRKRAEAAHEEALERFRLAFEESPVGMVLLDVGGRFERTNDAFCRMVGYPCEQLLGLSFEAITHPDDITRNVEGLLAVLAGERASYTTEKRYIHASGHEITVALQTTVLRAADGTPLNFFTHMQDITDRKRSDQQLAHLADHDALTGLLNGSAFERALAAHAPLAERYGATGAVLVIDLDEFRLANDKLGYQAADELIARTAQLLAERVRRSDVLARLSGNEFGVLLPNAGSSEALRVAESLLARVRSESIRIDERPLTASIGIAALADCSELSGEELLIKAGIAMHDAKQSGRDRAVLYSDGAHANATRSAARASGRAAWTERIQSAVRQDRLTLLAQPIIDLGTGNISQYELLLRMRDEHEDLIPPATFLYVAERLGLIGQIDARVASTAIRLLAADEGLLAGAALEVNLASASIKDPLFLECVRGELEASGVQPSRLIFEISQATALGAVTQAMAFGEQLQRLGCRFALDGFGAGPANFHYFKRLGLDLIKIDGELVRNCSDSDTDQLLIAAIVEVASGLGRRTVAMEIGDDQTLELLRELGVDYGQGYFVGAPAPLQVDVSTREPPTS